MTMTASATNVPASVATVPPRVPWWRRVSAWWRARAEARRPPIDGARVELTGAELGGLYERRAQALVIAAQRAKDAFFELLAARKAALDAGGPMAKLADKPEALEAEMARITELARDAEAIQFLALQFFATPHQRYRIGALAFQELAKLPR